MNPSCPYCDLTLELRTLNYKSDETLRKPDSRSSFYVCPECNKHWPRSAVISVNTARDGVKPKGVAKL